MKRVAWTIGAALLVSAWWTPAQAASAGWAVRICRSENEASAIKIDVSDGKTSKLLVNWQSDNEQTNFKVPAPLNRAASLSVTADSEPADGKVVMCIMWKGKPAKTMHFKDLLEATAKQSDSDPSCPCK
ncbi:MAG: hypothetical protein ABI629_12930 [bacterium]